MILFYIGTIFFSLINSFVGFFSCPESVGKDIYQKVIEYLFIPLSALLIRSRKPLNFLKIHFRCSLNDSVDMFLGDKQSHDD